MERKRRISAPFLRTGLNNYRQSKTAAQPENTIIALIQAEIADNIFSPITLLIGNYRLKGQESGGGIRPLCRNMDRGRSTRPQILFFAGIE